MANEIPDDKNRLTIELPENLAHRLKLAAANQKRAASDVVLALLDRHLPRLDAPGKKKGGFIPYS